MRHLTLLTLATFLALATTGPAQSPGGAGLPALYSYLGTNNFAGSYAGPRVYGPGGYYSYQLYAYNPAARYGYYHGLSAGRTSHSVTVHTRRGRP